MLTTRLVHGFSTQDSADGSCSEESCAKRFIRVERISDLEDRGFGALAICFRAFVFLQALVQLPRGGVDLPRRERNFSFFNQREGLLNRFPRTLQVALSQGHSCLQIPGERLEMRIAGGQRGL